MHALDYTDWIEIVLTFCSRMLWHTSLCQITGFEVYVHQGRRIQLTDIQTCPQVCLVYLVIPPDHHHLTSCHQYHLTVSSYPDQHHSQTSTLTSQLVCFFGWVSKCLAKLFAKNAAFDTWQSVNAPDIRADANVPRRADWRSFPSRRFAPQMSVMVLCER